MAYKIIISEDIQKWFNCDEYVDGISLKLENDKQLELMTDICKSNNLTMTIVFE